MQTDAAEKAADAAGFVFSVWPEFRGQPREFIIGNALTCHAAIVSCGRDERKLKGVRQIGCIDHEKLGD